MQSQLDQVDKLHNRINDVINNQHDHELKDEKRFTVIEGDIKSLCAQADRIEEKGDNTERTVLEIKGLVQQIIRDDAKRVESETKRDSEMRYKKRALWTIETAKNALIAAGIVIGGYFGVKAVVGSEPTPSQNNDSKTRERHNESSALPTKRE